MSGTMQAVRQSCIELVESVDTVIRRADEVKDRGDPTSFDEAVVTVMKRIASIPAIHRLRGRVREASDTEIIAAMTFMTELSDRDSGEEIIRALIAAAIEAGKPDVADRLRRLQAEELKRKQAAEAN